MLKRGKSNGRKNKRKNMEGKKNEKEYMKENEKVKKHMCYPPTFMNLCRYEKQRRMK